MDKDDISQKYGDYKNLGMNDIEFSKELVFQKLLYEQYQNESNLLFVFLIALISMGTALYVSDLQQVDGIIGGWTVVFGIFFGYSYLNIRKKQEIISLNINVRNELKSNIIIDSAKVECNGNMNEIRSNQIEIGPKKFNVRIKRM